MNPADPSEGRELGPTESLLVLCSAESCTHDPQHIPLPSLWLGDINDSVLTRWTLTAEEREAVAKGADLWIWQEGIRRGGFPPILPTFEPPRYSEDVACCPDCRHVPIHDQGDDGTRCQFCPCENAWEPVA